MGYWFFKHFTSNTKFAMPGLGQGLGKRLKLDPRNARKKCWFFNILAKYHVPDLSAFFVAGLPAITVVQSRQAGLWGCGSGRFSGSKRLKNRIC